MQVVQRKSAPEVPREVLAPRWAHSAARPKGSKASDFTAFGASSWSSMSKRCVAFSLSSVALRNPCSVALAFDLSPKSTLKRVFQNLRRAARLKVSSRISERLAMCPSAGSARDAVKVSPRRAPLS